MYNGNMAKSVPNAFTLVELLVVIAIMAIIGAFSLANYRSFGEDRNLKNASLDIQSLLRQAQSNATTNTKCNTGFDARWMVEFAGTTTVNLKCQEPPPATVAVPKKSLAWANISISVSGTGTYCPSSPTVSFEAVTGKTSLGGVNCSVLTVTLTNTKTTKSFKIEQGGRIYEP